MHSYLSSRFQYVQINFFKSALLPIKCVVPQGSVLGPLLFLLYINDIFTCSNYLSFIPFADDTNIFFSAQQHLGTNLHHHILSRQCLNYARALLLTSLNSQCMLGPKDNPRECGPWSDFARHRTFWTVCKSPPVHIFKNLVLSTELIM